MMNGRNMEKRVKQLEGRHSGSPILVLLCDKGEPGKDRVTRWETENGPVGDRHALVVNFVDALI